MIYRDALGFPGRGSGYKDAFGMTRKDNITWSIVFFAAAAIIGYCGGRAVRHEVREEIYNSRVQAIERMTDISRDHRYVLKQQAEEAYERPNPLAKHEAGAAGALVACAGLGALVLCGTNKEKHPSEPAPQKPEKPDTSDDQGDDGKGTEPPPYRGTYR